MRYNHKQVDSLNEQLKRMKSVSKLSIILQTECHEFVKLC